MYIFNSPQPVVSNIHFQQIWLRLTVSYVRASYLYTNVCSTLYGKHYQYSESIHYWNQHIDPSATHQYYEYNSRLYYKSRGGLYTLFYYFDDADLVQKHNLHSRRIRNHRTILPSNRLTTIIMTKPNYGIKNFKILIFIVCSILNNRVGYRIL